MQSGSTDFERWPATNPFRPVVLQSNNPFKKDLTDTEEDEEVALGELYPSKQRNNPVVDALVERYKLQPHPSLTFQEDYLIKLKLIDDCQSTHLKYEPLSNIKKRDKDRYANPLEPPPAQFSRPARAGANVAPQPFEPTCIYSLKHTLHDGFPSLYPTCLNSHNVTPDDWKRFVQDICLIDLNGLNSKPPKPLLHRYLHKHANNFKSVEVAIHLWNKNFFIPRKVLVWLQSPPECSSTCYRLLLLSIPQSA